MNLAFYLIISYHNIVSYIRGPYYTYTGANDEGEDIIFLPEEMPLKVFDELVVMRFAQMEEWVLVKKAEERAIENHAGNFGCDSLCKKYGKPTVKSVLDEMEKESRKKKE